MPVSYTHLDVYKRQAVRYGAEVFHALKKIIHDKGMSLSLIHI